MTIVVDHDTGTLIWAAAGRDTKTLRRFFDALGAERCKLITHVSADAADWIADVVTERCPGAIRCADPFHVVAWATEALDAERRRAWNDARALARTEPRRGPGRPRNNSAPPPAHERVRKLKGARYALWKNPEDLTDRQSAKLAWIAKTDPRLYRAYLLKEGLRHVFSVKGEEGKQALDRWISLGAPLPHPGVRGTGRPHRAPPPGHRRRPRPRPIAGADRIHQHQDQGVDPRRVRLPLRRSAHRPGHARPRRPPARTARTRLTPTTPSSANSAAPVSGSGRRIDAGTPAAALGQQQRAGQACPSALTSLKPPHPA